MRQKISTLLAMAIGLVMVALSVIFALLQAK